ncbi:MAG: hypothetical protein ABIQ53_07585 [Terracoccus sp.]
MTTASAPASAAASSATAPAGRRPPLMRWREVAELTALRGYPCISVLMPTTPAERMTDEDTATLTGLVAQVSERLGEADGLLGATHLMAELRAITTGLRQEPTTAALAVYVNLAYSRVLHLPAPVKPKAVVEATFATRDLVRALHRAPPHLIVTLRPGCAHFFNAQGTSLYAGDVISTAGCDHASWVADPRTLESQATAAFLGEVDLALKRHREAHPRPLVLGGAWGLTAALRQRSPNLHRLAGTLAPAECVSEHTMLAASSRLLEAYLVTREAEALALVDTTAAQRPDQLATGIRAVWNAARTSRPRMLAVEDGYTVPGHPSGPTDPETDIGQNLQHGVAGEADDPEQVHDLIDDLIEIVIQRGGEVALVRDGHLSRHNRVAIVTHPRP